VGSIQTVFESKVALFANWANLGVFNRKLLFGWWRV